MTNKLNRLISLLLLISLTVSCILPTNVFAGSNGAAGSYSYSGSGGGGGGASSVKNTNGGWRFSLLFLSGDAGGGSIIDSVGNVNIDEWQNHKDEVQVVGSLDVYVDGYDDPTSNKSYGLKSFNGISSFFLFDVQGIGRQSQILSPSDRNMASSSELGLSDLPWKYNVNLGSASSINEILVRPVANETVNIELYPNNPEGQRVVESQKYELTEDCAKIIDELCKQSGLTGDEIVYCETARGEDTSKKNVFEQGMFNGKTGSYRLMIEPYEIVSPAGNGYWAMTLRDCIWYHKVVEGGSTGSSSFAYNLGNYLCGLTNFAYMEYKDICKINNSLTYQDNTKLEDYTNKLKPIDYNSLSGSITKFVRNAVAGVEANKGYGIASISSEMVKSKPQEMFIGSVSNLFLPYAYDGTNTDPVSYSIEYAGQKAETTFLKDTAKALIDAINNAKEPDSLTGTKASLSQLNESEYEKLTNAVTKQLETKYTPDEYSVRIKMLAKDIIKDENFKNFIETVYYSNSISAEYASKDGGELADTPLTQWCEMLVLQSMLKNGTVDNADKSANTALSIQSKDLAENNIYKGLGLNFLSDEVSSKVNGMMSGDTSQKSYVSNYMKIAQTDNTVFGNNRISGDKELSDLFKQTNTEITQDGAKFIRKPIYIGHNTFDIERLNSDYQGLLSDDGNEVDPTASDYSLIRMRYNFIGDMTDNILENFGDLVYEIISNPENTKDSSNFLFNLLQSEVAKNGQIKQAYNLMIEAMNSSDVDTSALGKFNATVIQGNLLPELIASLDSGKITAITNKLSTTAYYGLPQDESSSKVWAVTFNEFGTNRTTASGVWLSSLIGSSATEFKSSSDNRRNINRETVAGFVDKDKLGEFNIYNGLGRTQISNVSEYQDADGLDAFSNGKLLTINEASFINSSNNDGSLVNAVTNYVLNNAIAQSKELSKIAPDDGSAGGYAQAIKGEYGNAQVIWGLAMPMDILFVTEDSNGELVPLESLTGNNDWTIIPEQFWVTPGFESNIHIPDSFRIANGSENGITVKVKSAAVKPSAVDAGEFVSNYTDALIDADPANKASVVSLDNKVESEGSSKVGLYSRVYFVNEGNQMSADDKRAMITDPSNPQFGQFVPVDRKNKPLYLENIMNIVPTNADKVAYMEDPENNRLQLVLNVEINAKPVQYNFIEDENGNIIEIQKVAQNRGTDGTLILEPNIVSNKSTSIPVIESMLTSPTDYKFKEDDKIPEWKNVIEIIKDPTPPGEFPEEQLEDDDYEEPDIPPDDTVYVRYICYPPQYNVYRYADGNERVEVVPQNWNKTKKYEYLYLQPSLTDTNNVNFEIKQWGLNDTNIDITSWDTLNLWQNTASKIGWKFKYGREGSGKNYNYDNKSAVMDMTINSISDNNAVSELRMGGSDIRYGYDPKEMEDTDNKSALNKLRPSSYIYSNGSTGLYRKNRDTVYVLYVEQKENADGFNLVLPQNMLTKRFTYKEILTSYLGGNVDNGKYENNIDDTIDIYSTFYLDLLGKGSVGDSGQKTKSKDYFTTKVRYCSNDRDIGYYSSNIGNSYHYEVGLYENGSDNNNNDSMITATSGKGSLFTPYTYIEGTKNIASQAEDKLYTEKADEFDLLNVSADKAPCIVVYRGSDRPTLVSTNSNANIVKAAGFNISSNGPVFNVTSKTGLNGVRFNSYNSTRRKQQTGVQMTPSNKQPINGVLVDNGYISFASPTSSLVDKDGNNIGKAIKNANTYKDEYSLDGNGDAVKAGYYLPMKLRFGALSVNRSGNNGISYTYHSHKSGENGHSEGCSTSNSVSSRLLNTEYKKFSGALHVRSFVGDEGSDSAITRTPSTTYNTFIIGNNYYKGSTVHAYSLDITDKLKFYPWVTMKYETNKPNSTAFTKAWSELPSSMTVKDSVAVGMIPAGVNPTDATRSDSNQIGLMGIESDQWSTHNKASVYSITSNGNTSKKVLPGGAIYRLRCGISGTPDTDDGGGKYTNNTKVGFKGYFIYVPNGAIGHTSTIPESFNINNINKSFEDMVTEGTKSLESVNVIQRYGADSTSNSLSVSKSNVTNAPTNDSANKYNLQGRNNDDGIKNNVNANDADLNVIAKNVSDRMYTIWSEANVDGTGYKFCIAKFNSVPTDMNSIRSNRNSKIVATWSPSVNTEQAVNTINSSGLAGLGFNFSSDDKEIIRIDEATGAFSHYIASMEFGYGLDKSEITNYSKAVSTRKESKASSITIVDSGNHWYNEESDGVCVAVKGTELVIGFTDNANSVKTTGSSMGGFRTAAINPVDTPARGSTSEMYTKVKPTMWFTEAKSGYAVSKGENATYLTTYSLAGNSIKAYLSYDLLYCSEAIMVPNATVMDLS